MNRFGVLVSSGIKSAVKTQLSVSSAYKPLHQQSLYSRQFSSKPSGGKGREHIKEAEIKSSKTATKEITKESNLEQYKKELVSLSSSEIRAIKENQETHFSSTSEEAQGWLKTSGYAVEEKEDAILISRSTPAYTVEVFFNPYPEDDEAGMGHDSEMGAEEKEEGASDEEQSESEVQEEDKESVKSLPFHAEITFNDKQGQQKGRLVFGGEVGGDCRVYVNEMQSTTQPKTGTDKDKMIPTAIFERLSQDMQDRMYDLLDEVGIDDRMGSFIRYYADTYEDTNTISVLENINKILGDK